MDVPPPFAARARTVDHPRPHYWIEAPIGDTWVAAYRIVLQDDRPLIAELRVFPAEGPHGDYTPAPGEWSGTYIAAAVVPGRGITAGLLRKQVNPGLPLDHFKELRARMEKLATEHWGEAPARRTDARGRKSRPALFFAEVARDYVAALERGSGHPAMDLAASRGITRASARALVNQARVRGFLTPAFQGRRGGELTAAAARLLARSGRPMGRRSARKRGR